MSADKPDNPRKPTRRPSRGRLSRAQTLRAAGKLTRRLLLAAKGRLDEELRPQEVTAAQLRILAEVRTQPGTSGATLARACGVTPQTAQAMLAKAVERGWLERGKDSANDRLVTFSLTAAGSEMLAHGETTYAKIETRIWRGIETADVEAFSQLIERALNNIDPQD